jgi:hypothetical protein
MVIGRQTRLGCALSRYSDYSGRKNQLFVCEYSACPITDKKIFVEGVPASGCETGENSRYPGLCSLDEVIDPNNYGQKMTKNNQIIY